MLWILCNDDFARRANGGAQQMAAMSRSIFPSNDDMRMNLRLVVFEGDISNQREQLNLFLKFDCSLIFLRLPVKPAKFDAA